MRKRVLNELHFDETMNFLGGMPAINQVIVSEGKYGLIQDTFYFYRKREDESSLVDTAWHKKSAIQRCYRPVMDSYLPTQGKNPIVLFLMCSTW